MDRKTKIVLALFAIGVLGTFCNLVALIANNFEMPVVTSENFSSIRLPFLADYFSYRNSKLVNFLFPGGYAVSVGDLMIATWFNFTWWTALALTVRRALGAVRGRLFS